MTLRVRTSILLIALWGGCLLQTAFAGSSTAKFVYIIFENASYNKVMKNPYFKELSKKGLQFSNMHAETHPSQGNYIAMISGTDFGVHTDKDVNLEGRHLGDLIEEAGLEWRVYADGYPGSCFLGNHKKYVRKHVPFLSFKNIQTDSKRCERIVNSTQFKSDIKSDRLPNFSMYIPDLDNDGHDTGVTFASNWLEKNFGEMFADKKFLSDKIFVITFDEGSWIGSNQIYTLLLGGDVAPRVSNTRFSHYSLLRLVEDSLGLGSLGRRDESASQISL